MKINYLDFKDIEQAAKQAQFCRNQNDLREEEERKHESVVGVLALSLLSLLFILMSLFASRWDQGRAPSSKLKVNSNPTAQR